MSFPSAIIRRNAGDTSEAALLFAMEHDTPLGFMALTAMTDALRSGDKCPCCAVKQAIGPLHAKSVLRHERIGQGSKVDFHPDSEVGRQVTRLMTDMPRALLEQHTGMHFGFANCCGAVTSPDKKDTKFTAEDQIRWQVSIDC